MIKQLIAIVLVGLAAATAAGCSGRDAGSTPSPQGASPLSSQSAAPGREEAENTAASPGPAGDASSGAEGESGGAAEAGLTVRFGDGGSPFTLHLYDNATAAAIAGYVGTADWRLPIYHYDDYDNWEVMQYYDIPSRYDIPSSAEAVTAEAAGTVYYSEPNRIVLFYQDAQVSGEYTPVGYFDYTEEFRAAVEENPVLEGWGNKIVNISDGE